MVANIWVAASDNEIKIVEDYLNSGKFTANSKDPNGYTPIHAAASYGHIELLKLLISKGGDINIQDNEGDTPLHHCEDVKTAKVIIEDFHGDWKIKNEDGQTALEYKEEDEEFPELIAYLKQVKYGGAEPATSLELEAQANEFLLSLPLPGNIEGRDIRYTMETEDTGEVDEDRRKQIEAILNGENPEQGLRDLVTKAVHEGMVQYEQQGTLEESNKRRKD